MPSTISWFVEAAGELVEESYTCPSSPLKEVSLPLHWEILMSMLKIPLRLQAEGRADEAIQCRVKEHLSGIGLWDLRENCTLSAASGLITLPPATN